MNGIKQSEHKFNDFKESVLSHGTAALLHLISIEQANKQCQKEFELFEDQLNLQDDRIVFSSQSLGFLLNEISPSLSTLRMLQNKLIMFVNIMEKPKNSLPVSISDYVKNSEQYKISKETKTIILKYWNSTGKYAKFFRDIDQHDITNNPLTSRYFMQITPRKTVFLEFPDYQHPIQRSKFEYGEKINGIEFLNQSFTELHQAFEDLANFYGSSPTPHQQSVRLAQLGDLTPFRNRTLAVLYEINFKSEKGATTLNLSALRVDHQADGKVNLRELYLKNDSLEKAKTHYGTK